MIIYYTKEGEFKVNNSIGIIYVELHRLDGPAVLFENGSKEWWVDGKLHRISGPAIEWVNGTKEWWVNGKRHRIGGPSIEGPTGNKSYFINDKKLNTKKVETWIKDNNINLKTKQHQALFMLRFG